MVEAFHSGGGIAAVLSPLSEHTNTPDTRFFWNLFLPLSFSPAPGSRH